MARPSLFETRGIIPNPHSSSSLMIAGNQDSIAHGNKGIHSGKSRHHSRPLNQSRLRQGLVGYLDPADLDLGTVRAITMGKVDVPVVLEIGFNLHPGILVIPNFPA
jgi:hypothetical protein